MIIDFHSHLGNILIEDGGRIATQKNVRKKHPFDPDVLGRAFLYNNKLVTHLDDSPFLRRLISRAEQKRCMMASRDKLIYYMDKHGVDKSVVLSIAPNVTFCDIYEACKDTDRLIPFGSVDFTKDDIMHQVRWQLKKGAKGFKIHPILQQVKADSSLMHQMMDACDDGTVILAHTGYSDYYPKKHKTKQMIEYGDIASFANLAKSFPNLRFVAAHAGLREIDDAIKYLSCLKNVWVDISFQSPNNIIRLMKAFGEGKVLFASDWPYGFHKTAIRCVKKAIGNDKKLMNKIFLENANTLLNFNRQ